MDLLLANQQTIMANQQQLMANQHAMERSMEKMESLMLQLLRALEGKSLEQSVMVFNDP